MAETKGRGRGGKLVRSEVVQVRLDPKLRFAAELAAGKERRTLSSFIEWAVGQAVGNVALFVELNDTVSAADVADAVWDPDDADRCINLARRFPGLLTHDEMRRWKFIKETRILWREVSGLSVNWEPNLPLIRAAWGLITQHIASREPFDWDALRALARLHGLTDAQIAEGTGNAGWNLDREIAAHLPDQDIPF